jgi:hypothetical protein
VTLEELGEEGRDTADHQEHSSQCTGSTLEGGFETRRIRGACGLDQRSRSARGPRRLRAFGEGRFEIRLQGCLHGLGSVGTRVARVKLCKSCVRMEASGDLLAETFERVIRAQGRRLRIPG